MDYGTATFKPLELARHSLGFSGLIETMEVLDLKKLIAILITAMSLVTAMPAHAVLMLSPGDEVFSGSIPNNPDASDVESITSSAVGSLTQLYKADVANPVVESGGFAGSYDTVFMNTQLDPEDATISYVGGAVITNPEYLLVKDGNQDPIWYIFDVATWDGLMDIELTSFWPAQGAISHVSIFGGEARQVSEPATLALVGIGLLALCRAKTRRIVGLHRHSPHSA